MTSITVVIPTRGRAGYLDVALESIAPQARTSGATMLVVMDGPDVEAATVGQRHGAELIALPEPAGLNAARNAAIEHVRVATGQRAAGDGAPDHLIVFVDDDIAATAGWLAALSSAAETCPDHDVFGGPITPWLENGGPRHCGREPAPITALDLGSDDRDCRYVWGANMAVRLRAFSRLGDFAAELNGRGDEEEWLDRLHATGGRVRYVGAAEVIHRRTGRDAQLPGLMRAGFHLGRASRANDVRKGTIPSLRTELRGLAGASWHTVARSCAYGLVFAAHAVGRIEETVSPSPAPTDPELFASGLSGFVAGRRAEVIARIADATADARGWLAGIRLRRDAAFWSPPRRVQVLALERKDRPNILDAAVAELERSHHHVSIARADAGDRGRFENLNALLDAHRDQLAATDWLILLDDDVALPPGFLDSFLFLAERHQLTLAQPAHRRRSHAAWPVTRRRPGVAVRETGFVEIGPLVAFQRAAFADLLPFPHLRIGWGADAYWAAIATQRGWKMGVIDATPIAHSLRPVAASYDQSAAVEESRAFLATHPHITATQANRTLRTHRSW